MPIYEFRCLKCNECFEILVMKKEEAVESRCPKCGSEEFERVLSKTCYSMASGGGQPSGGVSAQSRTCSSGSCTTWEIPGHSR
jgi:putative FmdB family regulatory protein